NYMLFNNSNLKIGTLVVNRKGFGFVDIENDHDIFIAPNNMNSAIHGDKVVVEIISKKGMDQEGRIQKVIERKTNVFVGEFYYKSGKPYVKLDDIKIKINIKVDKNKTNGAANGHKVVLKISNYNKKENCYIGEIVKILGHKNDPGVDILSIVNSLGIRSEFPEEVLREVAKLPTEVRDVDMHGRIDLRDENIVTIDGDDTKDIDDAVSFKYKENGNMELGIHIADVDYYVKEGSNLDKEAYLRGTSVYLTDRVIPMYPQALSNGICSLNPGVDRLAISCVMEIDNKGNIVDYDIFESVIHSKKQMTYKNVNKILEEGIVPEGYEEYKHMINGMGQLAKILRKNKIDRGYIDFDIDESKILVDTKGKPYDVVLRYRGEGENLIEDFMITANETITTHIYHMSLPFIYRVHGEPSEEKINTFLKLVSLFGYKIDGKIKDIHPKTMQGILKQLKTKKEYPILSRILLRSMQKAIYSEQNIGHYGLASKNYTHFTSPIRRYPDTIVHRLLRKYLFKTDFENAIEYYEKQLPQIARQSSIMERLAIECEREVDDMKKAEYMLDHIGEEYEGIISSVMSFGIFVELPNLIEGLVRSDDLSDDNYIYDEATFSLVGRSKGKRYQIGQKIKVKVKSASKLAGNIDFIVSN
ncbi:MAG TPA: ribonuclease R, partial [Tenericutes bacterium]|nr:ribonuclease R [Mycoplasmatota bacterium]